MTTTRGPLVLVVLDGWGLREEREGNAIKLARTPTYLELLERFPHSSLEASGEIVGLPAGQMGNSEVGHITMGAGRIVYQDLTRIDKSIKDGDFFEKAAFVEAMARCDHDAHALHLIGLVSPNGIHSHTRHLYALVEMAARLKVKRLFVQAFTDGRDTSPAGGAGFVGELEQVMAKAGTGQIASVGGRYYGMDRDNRWERTRRAYDAMVGAGPGETGPHQGTGPRRARSAVDFIRKSYEAGVSDEFIEPGTIVDASNEPVGPIRDGDSVIFFNFRSDRARQLTRALAFDDFDGFERHPHPRLSMTTMTQYDRTFPFPVAFPPQSLIGSFAEVMAAQGLTNLRVAETEKYPHVSYFFNCGIEKSYPGEDRILVPSPKVPTYDLQPEMSAKGITDTLVKDVESRKHDVIICNFANADMVGHTGNIDAAVKAVETIDHCLGRIVRAVREAEGTLIVTSDHGNAEEMWNTELNEPHTAHTCNPVPVIVVEKVNGVRLRDGGALRDIAPTMIGILGVPAPKEMTGTDLRSL
ncbi:MAG TPA: 2,3-bisphosphoglycerate-independent phosphoglycerate mutase [Vicinamibacterales bacterium]|nr:2,3-bisphosphoglycerate-independent phosphoglycerate mutase [Vicinamibacterales bacterium]